MKTLRRIVKFFRKKEPNPVKGQEYFSSVAWFRDDIQDARKNNDWHRLWQYRFLFVAIAFRIIHFLYLYWTVLNEIESYLLVDMFDWIHLDKLANLVACGPLLLFAFLLHSFYFSNDMHYFFDWYKKIILEQKPVNYHWPLHYKKKDCSRLIRKMFMTLFKLCQLMIVTAGDIRNWHFLITILMLFYRFLYASDYGSLLEVYIGKVATLPVQSETTVPGDSVALVICVTGIQFDDRGPLFGILHHHCCGGDVHLENSAMADQPRRHLLSNLPSPYHRSTYAHLSEDFDLHLHH